LPTFDVGTLDSQDFTKGLLSEIDPHVIKTLSIRASIRES
jgi:hypothetical protein